MLNSQMSAKDKYGLRYGSQIHDGILSYENEVFATVFDNRSSDVEDSHANDKFAKVEGMHAVPPHMTGNYMPHKSNFRIDESKFTYGLKQSTTSESDAKTSDLDSCESSSSEETLETVPKLVESKPKSKVECFNCHNTLEGECRSKGNQDTRRRGIETLDTRQGTMERDLQNRMNTKMSAKDKSELRYGSQIHDGILSYENEVFATVFDNRSSDVEDSHANDRFAKVEGMHAVPPPMTGNYMPPKSNFRIDESKFTYDLKQSTTSESDAKTSYLDSCESSSSEETLETVPKLVESKPKVVNEPKVWSNAPIIEEYESDSDDEYVFKASVEQEKPSCAFINTVKHVKTPRQTIQNQDTCSQNLKVNQRGWTGLKSKRMGLGYGYTKKACFVCGSFSYLIRDCDLHEKKMAKQVELNKQKGKSTGPRENRPVWSNVQRLNLQNKFVPTVVLTKTGRFLVNAAR
nr:ribonuclease H-like domain-containing protein [Tanacetum cinerariifolium]